MPNKLFLLCATKRCGSGLLRDYLVGNGIPMKEFPMFQAETAKGIAHEIINAPEPIVGVKPGVLDMLDRELPTAYEWFTTFLNHIEISGIEIVWAYMDRRSHVRQAMSMTRANHLGEGGIYEPSSRRLNLTYSRGRIEGKMEMFRQQRVWWEAFFDRQDIDPFSIIYEDFRYDRPGFLKEIAHLLDVHEFDLNVKLRIKQAGAGVEEHVQAYYDDVLSWGSRNE